MSTAPVAPVILVVEDEEAIRTAVVARLETEGYRVLTADTGPGAVEMFHLHRPDLIVLDLNLPGFDGLEVCRQVRAIRPVAVVMMTARDDETDLLVGFGLGADDYVTKPFSPRELAARVRAVLRRTDATAPADLDVLSIGSLVLDLPRRQVRFQGGAIHLTPTEFDLLRVLAEAKGAVLSREELLNRVWGYSDSSGLRTIDSHLRSVRRKMSDNLIRTVHGVGYSLGEVN